MDDALDIMRQFAAFVVAVAACIVDQDWFPWVVAAIVFGYLVRGKTRDIIALARAVATAFLVGALAAIFQAVIGG